MVERSTRERKKNSRYDDGVEDEQHGSRNSSMKQFSFQKCDYDMSEGDDMETGMENDDGSSSHSIFELCKVTQSIGRRGVGSKTSKGANAAGRKPRQPSIIDPEKILIAAEKNKERRKKREMLLNFAKIDSESDEDDGVVVPKAKFAGFRQPKSYPSLWAGLFISHIRPSSSIPLLLISVLSLTIHFPLCRGLREELPSRGHDALRHQRQHRQRPKHRKHLG